MASNPNVPPAIERRRQPLIDGGTTVPLFKTKTFIAGAMAIAAALYQIVQFYNDAHQDHPFIPQIMIVAAGLFAWWSRTQSTKVATLTGGPTKNSPRSENMPRNSRMMGSLIFVFGFWSVLSLGLVTATVTGCQKKHIANVPPGVSESQVNDWYTATGAVSIVADNTKAAVDLIVDLNHNGEFPDGDAYNQTLSVFGGIAQGGIHARNVLSAMPENFNEDTRSQIVDFATTALAELAKWQLSRQSSGMRTANVDGAAGMQKVNDLTASIKKALEKLQSLKTPAATSNMFLDTWDGIVAVHRAEGLLLIGKL